METTKLSNEITFQSSIWDDDLKKLLEKKVADLPDNFITGLVIDNMPEVNEDNEDENKAIIEPVDLLQLEDGSLIFYNIHLKIFRPDGETNNPETIAKQLDSIKKWIKEENNIE